MAYYDWTDDAMCIRFYNQLRDTRTYRVLQKGVTLERQCQRYTMHIAPGACVHWHIPRTWTQAVGHRRFREDSIP